MLSVQATNCGAEGLTSDPVTVYLKNKQLLFMYVYDTGFTLCFEDIYLHYSTATLPNPTTLVHYTTGISHLRIMNLAKHNWHTLIHIVVSD